MLTTQSEVRLTAPTHWPHLCLASSVFELGTSVAVQGLCSLASHSRTLPSSLALATSPVAAQCEIAWMYFWCPVNVAVSSQSI